MATSYARFRAFNRFWTRVLGLFSRRLLGGPLGLAEARVLWDIGHDPGATAAALAADLGMDRGQLSRLLGRLTEKGLIRRRAAPSGRRPAPLAITERGQALLADLEAAADRQAGTILDPLAPRDLARLLAILDEAQALLSPGPEASGVPQEGEQAVSPDASSVSDAARDPGSAPLPAVAQDMARGSVQDMTPAEPPKILIRPARPGDMGWVIQRHALIYASEWGFGPEFERYVLLGLAASLQSRSGRKGLWIAEREGEALGSVGVVEATANQAQLRWLLVEPAARGLGLGRALVEQALAHCREHGFASVFLWTLRALEPARRLYASLDFSLAEEKPGLMGGQPHVEERWELRLT